MDALVDILNARGLGPYFKWVDNNINFRAPVGKDERGAWLYRFSVHDIFASTEALGVPWHQEKWTEHEWDNEYLGFWWSLPARSVSLTEKKRLKYFAKVDVFLAHPRVDLNTAQSLNGTLAHVAFVIPLGRGNLPNLFALCASFSHEHQRRKPSPATISDVRWWREALSKPSPARSLKPRGALRNDKI